MARRGTSAGWLVLGAACALIGGCGSAAREVAPAFSAVDASGTAVTLEEYRGRVVLLEFWATWCGPCIGSMPQVRALEERFGGSGEFLVLAVHTDESGDPAGMLAGLGVESRLIPRGRAVARAYDAWALPLYVLVGRDGTVVHRREGSLTVAARETLAGRIEGALAE